MSVLFYRDYSSWRRDSRPPDGANPYHQPHHQRAQWSSRPLEKDQNGFAFPPPPPAPLSLRGRAMSENDLRFDSSQRWSPSISASTSQTLSEVEEGAGGVRSRETNATQTNRKKTPPPPRPPPPKWEQFHRRRASHHALFSSSSFSSSPPNSINSFAPPPSETSRQRSYSLPPERQGATESCPHCNCNQQFTHNPQTREHAFSHAPSNQNQEFHERPFAVAPPSPMFSRRAFRPVAPPQREREQRGVYGGGQVEREEALPTPPPPPPPAEESLNR